jgi:hypothetical protein
MKPLAQKLSEAISGLGLNVVITREYGEGKSAGFRVLDVNGKRTMSIDIDMRQALTRREYHFGNITFFGVTPDNVIADKIAAISTDQIFRRAKDLVDLYALSSCVTVKTTEIRELWEIGAREISAFDGFRNRLGELRHAYDKLVGIELKPEFEVVYGRLNVFLAPFIESAAAPLVWEPRQSVWSSDLPRPARASSPQM